MARVWRLVDARLDSSPCTRRDGAWSSQRFAIGCPFSLHAQGWPDHLAHAAWNLLVLPARAGMARPGGDRPGGHRGSPCTRRDGPNPLDNNWTRGLFSLHAQGWPTDLITTIWRWFVLPARAGMARKDPYRSSHSACSPCTRRDGPLQAHSYWRAFAFSLHAQGWPTDLITTIWRWFVLPARAGMTRLVFEFQEASLCSPCTRRDGPR